jgi:N-acetylmuramoyl-L-alanine amidase
VKKMVQIVKDYVKVNPYTRPARKNTGVEGIVMHYTASPRATAQNIRDYFNGTCIAQKRYASAHYAVDKKEIIQMIPDNEVAYHAHDRSRCYVDVLKPNANFSALGIEMCIEADGSLHPDTVKNARALVVYLLDKYNLPTSRVYRHYDVTGKNCPAMWVSDPSLFNSFKKSLSPAPSHSDEVVHTVVKGDTLWGIAQDHNTTVAKLEELNPHLDGVLNIGDKVTIRKVQPTGVQTPKPEEVKVVSPPKPKYVVPTGTLRYGDRGTSVKNLQICLNAVYFKCGEPDGVFGNMTLDALKRFQSVYANPVDGVYGNKTESALRRKLGL